VRGAPAIGICGAFGVALGTDAEAPDAASALASAERAAAAIAAARPTAVNLSWAVGRALAAARGACTANGACTAKEVYARVVAEALAVQHEDQESCRLIGEYGREELAGLTRLLTHCNTGRLATGGWGTALGVVYAKAEAGEAVEVYASESRPLLQGARLTAWELHQAGIPVTLVTDGMSAAVISSGRAQAVIVGCDRVALNGDTANKIGTFTHALVASAYGIPFFVAGPLSSFDGTANSGQDIVVEERSPDEVLGFGDVRVAADVPAWNPAFDITPGDYVTAFITDAGVIRPPYPKTVRAALKTGASNEHGE
jgi:methylthioribose-1-phosphate isomerase